MTKRKTKASDHPVSAARPPWRRRVKFVVVALMALAVLAEASSFAVLWVRAGRLPTWSVLHARRQALVDGTSPGAAVGAPGAAAGPTARAIHPFVGYVADPTFAPATHELGFDGPVDPVQTRGHDRIIVGVLGSAAAAAFVRNGIPLVARRVEAGRNKELVVVNLTREGYKQPQQLMALSYVLALGGAFDVVVNIDGMEDVTSHATGNATKGVHPAFPQDWYLLTSQAPDRQLRRLLGRRSYLESRMAALATSHSSFPLRYSMTAALVRDLRQKRLARHMAESTKSIRNHQIRTEERVPYRTRGPQLDSEAGEAIDLLVELWARGSILLDGLCRENDIRYLHFLEPRRTRDAEEAYERLRAAAPQLTASGVDFTDLSGEAAGETLAPAVDRVAEALGEVARARSK